MWTMNGWIIECADDATGNGRQRSLGEVYDCYSLYIDVTSAVNDAHENKIRNCINAVNDSIQAAT